jgi:hypothetical protein
MRRCCRPGRRRANRAIGARGRDARSGRNVAAPRLRCDPSAHASGRRGASDRGRRPDTNDSPSDSTSASASRQGLSLPGLRSALRAGPPHPPLGPRRPDEALEPHDAVPPASPRGSRGGFSGGAPAGRRASIQAAHGVVIPQVPPSPDPPADPVAVIRSRNEDNGLVLHARTALPCWLGERLDVAYAIDVLHPLASRQRTAETD